MSDKELEAEIRKLYEKIDDKNAEIERLKSILENPTQQMCDAARAYILFIRITNGCSYDGMRKHLQDSGVEIPSWMMEKQGHITK